MSVIIESDLKEILNKIDQRLDKLDTKIDNLSKDITDLKVGVAKLDEKVDGLLNVWITKGLLVVAF